MSQQQICAVLYVIILSAALDLVPPSTPKGIIAFCNIFPALVAKLGWPYLLKGRIRYTKRLIGCTIISISGMLVSVILATFPVASDSSIVQSRSLRYSIVCSWDCSESALHLSHQVRSRLHLSVFLETDCIPNCRSRRAYIPSTLNYISPTFGCRS